MGMTGRTSPIAITGSAGQVGHAPLACDSLTNQSCGPNTSLLRPVFSISHGAIRSRRRRVQRWREQRRRRRPTLTDADVDARDATDEDDVASWLTAGQALARMLLRARANDVWACSLNQPVEDEDLRSTLAEVSGSTGHPQLLLRLGYGGPPPA